MRPVLAESLSIALVCDEAVTRVAQRSLSWGCHGSVVDAAYIAVHT